MLTIPPDLMFGQRSPHWPAFRDSRIKAHPFCAATGTTEDLEAHHEVPYHECPERELDPTNIIILTRPIHFWIGHSGAWAATNPYCRADVARIAKRFKTRIYSTKGVFQMSAKECTAAETTALEARGQAVGLPSGIILALLAKYGPAIVAMILKLFEKQTMGAPGDAQAFKSSLDRVLELAAYGANLTATDVDNRAIATLKQIVDNTDLVELVFALIGK